MLERVASGGPALAPEDLGEEPVLGRGAGVVGHLAQDRDGVLIAEPAERARCRDARLAASAPGEIEEAIERATLSAADGRFVVAGSAVPVLAGFQEPTLVVRALGPGPHRLYLALRRGQVLPRESALGGGRGE